MLRGTGPWPARPAIAIVGARNATPYARRVAADVAAACARAGIAVVSGMARGVDGAAHAAALAAGGTTIAVLGTGVDTVYPPEHADLYTAIRRRGRLVSAVPHGAPPRRAHFPSRNRLMAALVEAAVLVQADGASGTRHTIASVLRQGGRAWIAPWPLDDARYAGNARWMARPHDRVSVLVAANQPARAAALSGIGTGGGSGPVARLAAACDARFRSLDDLARAAGLDAGAAAAAVLQLELAGVLEGAPGDRYRRRPSG